MKREIDKLYKNPSPATSTDAKKVTKKNDQLDLNFSEEEMVKKEQDSPYFRKIYKALGKK